MASDRVIAIKHAQAAEDNATAMKHMAESIRVLEEQNAALHEKLDGLMLLLNNNLNPANLLDALDAEAKRRNLEDTATPKPEPKKR